jgi:hypothetical protein
MFGYFLTHMAFLAQNSNSADDFTLDRHIKSISGSTGELKGLLCPSTRANHCEMWGYGNELERT